MIRKEFHLARAGVKSLLLQRYVGQKDRLVLLGAGSNLLPPVQRYRDRWTRI